MWTAIPQRQDREYRETEGTREHVRKGGKGDIKRDALLDEQEGRLR
jgi:hypothetical protein